MFIVYGDLRQSIFTVQDWHAMKIELLKYHINIDLMSFAHTPVSKMFMFSCNNLRLLTAMQGLIIQDEELIISRIRDLAP